MSLAGQKTVTAAGTPEILGSQAIPPGGFVYLQPLSTNTSTILVNDTSAGTATGWILAATDPKIMVEVSNLNQIWVDAAVNGEGVMWMVSKA